MRRPAIERQHRVPIVGTTQVIGDHEVTILVEVEELPEDPSGGSWHETWDAETRSGRAEKVMDATRDLFGDGLALARDCAVQAVHSIGQTDKDVRPDEFELQLAIKLDAQAGAVLAKVSTGAQMQVTMRWAASQGS